MKNHFPMRASTRRRFSRMAMLCAAAFPLAGGPLIQAAHAQATALSISSPKEGQTVRGTFKAAFSGVPDGGYAMVYIDLNAENRLEAFRGAVTNGTIQIDTFPLTDGRHTMTVIAYNSSGARVSQTVVPFDVANTQVDVGAQAVRLLNWTKEDLLDTDVQRYRVFAEATAKTTGGASAGGGMMGGMGGSMPGMGMGMPAMGGGGMPGGAMGGAGNTASLDRQVMLLIRRMTRDVGMVGGAANIKMNVKEAFERGREGASQGAMGGPGMIGGASMMGGGAMAAAKPANPDEWAKDWSPASENGQFYVKMIKADGQEINATRKKPTIALGDLLPRFPTAAVRPGSSWESEITLVAELVERKAITVRGPMYFTSFENIQTPNGVTRRCAKLESRFPLSQDAADKIAKTISSAGGSGAGGMGAMGGGMAGMSGGMPGGMGMMGGMGAGGMAGAAGAEVKNARTNVVRVMWFDVAARRLLRSEDTVETYYEGAAQAAGMGMGMSGPMGGSAMPGMGMPGMGMPGMMGGGRMGGMASAAPAEPTKTTYTLRVARYLDDTAPAPTDEYNAGAGTAHARDSVQDPSLAPVLRRRG